jgi:UDP-N-acetylmuramoylalanine--D-glutamate ligase
VKVAIAGFGQEGESSYRYYTARGDEVTVLDEGQTAQHNLPSQASARLGKDAFDNLVDFDIVVRTAGLDPRRLASASKVWSSTNEFFSKCRAPIIGVTGTKGKSTTATMIATIMKQSGRTVHLVGNIGRPALDALPTIQPEDAVVFELSSFQLWDLEYSPHIAVVLAVGSDHLDVHGEQAEYVAAKSHIVQYQESTDYVVYDSQNSTSMQIARASAARQIAFATNDENGVVIDGNDLVYSGEILCQTDDVKLPGNHNLRNACAAATAALLAGCDRASVCKGLRNLSALPHRMQTVSEADGIQYIDDNYSSSLLATLAALRSVEKPTVVILGGKDRGIERLSLLDELAQERYLKHAICIGEVRNELASELRLRGLENVSIVHGENMKDIVQQARATASAGDAVLMSPGFASFDMFTNFTDRAEQFTRAVMELTHDYPESFYFESYSFDESSNTAVFRYRFDDKRTFVERVTFDLFDHSYDQNVLDRALRLAHIVAGTSYYKCFSYAAIRADYELTQTDRDFIYKVYREGMSQFIYENQLDPDELGRLELTATGSDKPAPYQGNGVIALQSGGKDSLLLTELLKKTPTSYTAVYVTSSDVYPEVLDELGVELRIIHREIDRQALQSAEAAGGLNGHIPVSFIVFAYAIIDAVLHNENTVLMAVGREGDEPHAFIGELAITHQWSKTWFAELLFADYVARTVSPDIRIGSPLRQWSELRISELFSRLAWDHYASDFSSCNIGNYRQGEGARKLVWCGKCSKCANSYLLFSAFVSAAELQALFGGNDLYADGELQQTFRGLLGVDGEAKPFECVGEIDELRLAYNKSQQLGGYGKVSFDVPASSYDYLYEGTYQPWTRQYRTNDKEGAR